MIALHGARYLRHRLYKKDLEDIVEDNKDGGFPGCAGTIDYMTLRWKNCPPAHKGQYHNPREGKLGTIPAEAWCDVDLYTWHWYVPRTGAKNNINVMSNSPLMHDILSSVYGLSTGVGFKIVDNGLVRDNLYFLTDGIYPAWVIFAKAIN